MIRTTQQQFHPMMGHVIDGAIIDMDNGDALNLRATMHGWILESERETSPELPTAMHVEHYIVNHR